MSVDLPEPETPVTHVRTPSGNSTSIFLRLCCRAPTILMHVFAFLREFGISIDLRPVRYSRVSDRVGASPRRVVERPDGEPSPVNSSSAPFQTNSPPQLPRPGPRSIKLSAAQMI